MPEWLFQPRFRFSFTAISDSPLHCGNGGTADLRDRTRKLGLKDLEERFRNQPGGADLNPEYATVERAVDGNPTMPGSTVKGCLRSFALQRNRADRPLIKTLFGPSEIRGKEIRGNNGPPTGKLRFYAARFKSQTGPLLPAGERWFDPARCTAIQAAVGIDPHTRTASDKLLYWIEFVPERTSFEFLIEGDGLTDPEIGWFTALLNDAFSSNSPVQFGAESANGWGRFTLDDHQSVSVTRCGSDQVKAWWADPESPEPSFVAYQPPAAPATPATVARRLLTVSITLNFTGGFLVSEPTRFRKRTDSTDGLSHGIIRRSVTTRHGQPPGARDDYFLPAASVRGAIRAQARRIWLTLNGSAPSDPKKSQVHKPADVQSVSGFHQLFGCAGWRSPLSFSDFTLLSNPITYNQEFVAIDRFTGGAAPEKKFNATALWQPSFSGKLTIDLTALQRVGKVAAHLNRPSILSWYPLFLAFLFRDLEEGDITFGFGSAKGFGHCTATITRPTELALPQLSTNQEQALQAAVNLSRQEAA